MEFIWQICEEEGSRVHSQLLVQKADASGEQNPFEDDELDKILRARRKDITASGGEITSTIRINNMRQNSIDTTSLSSGDSSMMFFDDNTYYPPPKTIPRARATMLTK